MGIPGYGDEETWGPVTDPRDPRYDDSGAEAWCESRYEELLEDISEIDCLDADILLETIVENWPTGDKRRDETSAKWSELINSLEKYVEKMASAQADKDFENLEPDIDEDKARRM